MPSERRSSGGEHREKDTHIVVLIFGSNAGDRQGLMEEAMRRMGRIGVEECCSSWYETAPWGFEAEVPFINRVVCYRTILSPEAVLRVCMEVEQELGRVRGEGSGQAGGTPYSSRTMDIDILFYDSEVIRQTELIIPHPRIHLRNFVLQPLYEVMPEFIHPVLGKSVAELLEESPDTGQVKKM